MYAFDKMLENLRRKICTGKRRLKGSFSVIYFGTGFFFFFPKQVWLLFADSCPQIHWVVAFYLTCQVHIGVQKEQVPSPITASSKMDDSVVITLGCESAQHPLLLIHYYSVMAALSVR